MSLEARAEDAKGSFVQDGMGPEDWPLFDMQVEMTSFIAEVLQEWESPGALEILQSVQTEVACYIFLGQ